MVEEVPFGFEGVADEAVTTLLRLLLIEEEAPVDGHSAWLREDTHEHAPKDHEEEEMKDDEGRDAVEWLEQQHVLSHEEVVV